MRPHGAPDAVGFRDAMRPTRSAEPTRPAPHQTGEFSPGIARTTYSYRVYATAGGLRSAPATVAGATTR